jgi:hypothetical protein
MDPGNWATDLAGGSAFGYTLLSAILLSNLMAILLVFGTHRRTFGRSYERERQSKKRRANRKELQ